ncbi:hypothetical protein M407DRAFT_28534 [Tulasnella calospora MUT 4182]|uniref:Uncharacterized protein n=1 Tax=Tulasnella calospora MUT 4182 TaxID=1051891 RepID=A0A0C3KKI4_9AGAM|nr:hypothetical protein M407DRAFT_28534 [Tulasnella calospora MUT 4182]
MPAPKSDLSLVLSHLEAPKSNPQPTYTLLGSKSTNRDIRQNPPFEQPVPIVHAKGRPSKISKLSSKTIEYLQRLRNAHKEGEIAALVKPKYGYPKTNQVHTKFQYQRPDGKPYDFDKRILRTTQHIRIDITKCPNATLAYLVNNFPKSEVSISKSNLLIPYTPVTQAIAQAYQVLPIDTIIEYDSV